MKWTVLSDNRISSPLVSEHGLSVFLETSRHRLLLDTGASDAFLRNAQTLGVDLTTVDYVFISHGHSDHAGGLKYFLDSNQRAKVIMSPHALTGQYYSMKNRLHSITPVWRDIPANRLLAVDANTTIDADLLVMAHIPQHHAMPKGNHKLMVKTESGQLVPDDFRHELTLYTEGLLFTGCAHSGLENILAACPWRVDIVLGGYHLLDGYESRQELLALASRLTTHYPATQFLTSHCTGDETLQLLQQAMGSQLAAF